MEQRQEITIRPTFPMPELPELPELNMLTKSGRKSLEIRNNTKHAALRVQGHLFLGALSMSAAIRLDEERLRLLGDELDPRHMLRSELLAAIEMAAVNSMLDVQRRAFGGWW